MPKYIDCTIPLYDYMPVGNVWAWDVPFQTEPITTHGVNSFELWMITMHSEAGTRIMIKAMQDPNAPTVEKIPLAQLVSRPAVVIDVPCGMEGSVTAEQIEEGFKKADYRKGDVVILRTGWATMNAGKSWAMIIPAEAHASQKRGQKNFVKL
jgi:kynurenine formamidase